MRKEGRRGKKQREKREGGSKLGIERLKRKKGMGLSREKEVRKEVRRRGKKGRE